MEGTRAPRPAARARGTPSINDTVKTVARVLPLTLINIPSGCEPPTKLNNDDIYKWLCSLHAATGPTCSTLLDRKARSHLLLPPRHGGDGEMWLAFAHCAGVFATIDSACTPLRDRVRGSWRHEGARLARWV